MTANGGKSSRKKHGVGADLSPPSSEYLNDKKRGPALDKIVLLIITGLIVILMIMAIASLAI